MRARDVPLEWRPFVKRIIVPVEPDKFILGYGMISGWWTTQEKARRPYDFTDTWVAFARVSPG
jgi:hypothetical protein